MYFYSYVVKFHEPVNLLTISFILSNFHEMIGSGNQDDKLEFPVL